MEGKKTPYEIRLEILNLANKYAMDQWSQQQYWLEKQCTLMDDMMKNVKNEADIQMEAVKNNYQETMNKMQDLITAYPTEDAVLETARKFQEFVNFKR